MNVSLAWLKEFVKTSTKGVVLGERFRMTSSECEGVEDWGEKLQGLVVGKVEKVKQHPNADRLRIATVEADKKRTIVCGAPNLEEGQLVIVATPGTMLQPTTGEPFTISESTIRGEKSEGMLCALEEIGIAIPSDGIFVIEGSHKPGTSAASALFEDDVVIDLEITPNRPDLLSHFGLAREVSTFEQRSLTAPSITSLETSKQYPTKLAIDLKHHKDCSRFSLIALDVVIKPSPWWIQSRLLRSGIRPINNVVDVTNYVMLELGQPLHAYDAAALPVKDGAITLGVRRADAGEEIALLDESLRTLTETDVVITDAENKALGLAGIMGGATSGVTETTEKIVLEAATFNSASIRKTSRRLGLRSEASLRFEKGVDSELTVLALKRAASLLIDHSKATISSKIVDSHVHAPVRQRIRLSFDDINNLLGVRISAADCKEILLKLGFSLHNFTKSGFETVPPSWRRDVQLPEDVIEELMRIWGYERLPLTLPSGAVKAPKVNSSIASKRSIRHALAAAGMHETLHLTLCSEQALKKLNLSTKQAAALDNPLSLETAYLSPSHLIGMLADLGSANSEYAELMLFEIGKVFSAPQKEEERLTLLVRTSTSPEQALQRMKQLIERVCDVLSISRPAYSKHEGLAYAEHTVGIAIEGAEIGTITLIEPSIVAAHKIRKGRDIVAAEISLEKLLAFPEAPRIVKPLPIYPVSERDITVIVANTTELARIEKLVAQHIDTKLVVNWFVSNIFSGKPIEEGKKAVTIHLVYNSPERTLTDDEIKSHHEELEKALNNGSFK